MSQVQIRQALVTFLNSLSLPYLGTIYPSRTLVNENEYAQNASGAYVTSSNGSNAVMVIDLYGSNNRQLISLSGRNAVFDMATYTVELEVFFSNTTGNSAQNNLNIQADYDTFIDTLIPAIRNNPTLNAAATYNIWSSAEFDEGVKWAQSPPYLGSDGTTIFINGLITFDVKQQISGTGV